MKHEFESFIAQARVIRLQPAEKEDMRKSLLSDVRKGGDERLGVMHHDKFLNVAKNISLHSDEKAQVRALIFAAIEQDAQGSRLQFHGFRRLFSSVMASVMLFVVFGAGISYAAESALPGDVLYPIKVNVTETLLLRLNNSLEAKARVRARLATRRLEEAERLAAASLLNTERIAIIEERLAVHVAALETDLRELSVLNKKASADIAIDTAAEIEAHENLLLRIVQEKDRQAMKTLLKTTEKARNITAITAIADVDASEIIAITKARAEQEILKVKSAVKTKENAEVTEAIVKAETELTVSVTADIPASVQIEKSVSALRKAKEVKVFLQQPPEVKLKLVSPLPPPESLRLEKRMQQKKQLQLEAE